jgi:hypothetical protein
MTKHAPNTISAGPFSLAAGMVVIYAPQKMTLFAQDCFIAANVTARHHKSLKVIKGRCSVKTKCLCVALAIAIV